MSRLLSVLLVLVGVGVVLRTVSSGVGGGAGLLLGALLIAAGAGRLFLERH